MRAFYERRPLAAPAHVRGRSSWGRATQGRARRRAHPSTGKGRTHVTREGADLLDAAKAVGPFASPKSRENPGVVSEHRRARPRHRLHVRDDLASASGRRRRREGSEEGNRRARADQREAAELFRPPIGSQEPAIERVAGARSRNRGGACAGSTASPARAAVVAARVRSGLGTARSSRTRRGGDAASASPPACSRWREIPRMRCKERGLEWSRWRLGLGRLQAGADD